MAVACGMAPAALADSEIEGSVTDAGTGRPLAGARITVVDGQAAAMTGDEEIGRAHV